MSMDDPSHRDPAERGNDAEQNIDPRTGESRAEEELLQAAASKSGEEVPLPPEDETPLEIPPELIREEVREAQENGGRSTVCGESRSRTLFSIMSQNHLATCTCSMM